MRMKILLAFGVPLLWLATLASAVAVIHLRHHAGELTYQLSQERARHQRLLVAFGQLEIERNRQAVPGATWPQPSSQEGALP